MNQSLLLRSILWKCFEDNPERLSDNKLLQDWPVDELVSKAFQFGQKRIQPSEKGREGSTPVTERCNRGRDAFIKLARPTIVQDLLTTITNTIHDTYRSSSTSPPVCCSNPQK